jgi:hypothetical protein
MAPPIRKSVNQNHDTWYISGYNPETHTVIYEHIMGTRTIQPNDKIKIKNRTGEFTFGRVVRLHRTGSTWVDCLHPKGWWASFPVSEIKGPVPKRRKKKQ